MHLIDQIYKERKDPNHRLNVDFLVQNYESYNSEPFFELIDILVTIKKIRMTYFYASKYITEIDPKLLFEETPGEIQRRTTLEPYRKLYYVAK